MSADRFLPQRASLFYRSQDEFELTFRSDDEFELTSMEGRTTRYHRAQPWTPTAADLRAVDGRYRGEDTGAVFEVLPGTNGLVVRFERSPERAIEFEPVARDTYMRGLMIVRFRRDAGGEITGFDYSHPIVRDFRFTRLGDRTASAPAAPVAEDPETSRRTLPGTYLAMP